MYPFFNWTLYARHRTPKNRIIGELIGIRSCDGLMSAVLAL